MLEKQNYRHNLQFHPGDGFINGQGAGEVAKMKYGFYHMAWNGCEMIALYNAAHALGRHEPLADICLEMYPKSSVACGFFGCIQCIKDFFVQVVGKSGDYFGVFELRHLPVRPTFSASKPGDSHKNKCDNQNYVCKN